LNPSDGRLGRHGGGKARARSLRGRGRKEETKSEPGLGGSDGPLAPPLGQYGFQTETSAVPINLRTVKRSGEGQPEEILSRVGNKKIGYVGPARTSTIPSAGEKLTASK